MRFAQPRRRPRSWPPRPPVCSMHPHPPSLLDTAPASNTGATPRRSRCHLLLAQVQGAAAAGATPRSRRVGVRPKQVPPAAPTGAGCGANRCHLLRQQVQGPAPTGATPRRNRRGVALAQVPPAAKTGSGSAAVRCHPTPAQGQGPDLADTSRFRPTCSLCLRCTLCAVDRHATCALCVGCSYCQRLESTCVNKYTAR